MRLKSSEIATIKSVIESFDSDATIYLFGSRIDDNKKGGDIDIIVDSKKIVFKDFIKIKTKLYLALGDRKIDIVCKNRSAFVKYAMQRAVKL